MKNKPRLALFLYFLILILLSIYSWALVDPNLTLINHPLWESFRNKIILLGYFKRNLSTKIYFLFLFLLFGFHFYFLKTKPKIKALIFIIFLATFFSYPFLSHDFFNYLFDAKILLLYQQNPYFHSGLDFPQDPWLRFMHWTHRKYPYGPAFLIFSAIPQIFALNKFSLTYFLTKIFFTGFFLLSIYLLSKTDKNSALFILTNPLIIIEGIINSHNDLVALSLALLGIYFLQRDKTIKALFSLLFSGLIKYFSLPAMTMIFKNKKTTLLGFIGVLSAILYISFKSEAQPWYFINLFIFVPFYFNFLKKLNVLFFFLLASYYPYLKFSQWNLKSSIYLKHQIIIIGGVITSIVLCADFFLKKTKK